MNNANLEPVEHVLSTLKSDGSRRWLKPKLSIGNLLRFRRWVAWVLIIVFTAIPFIHVGSRPLVLLDITARQFTIFGFTFLPTDALLLAIFLVGTLLTIFLFTALKGRIWCGWACPQTVYMEFVFRPIERLFEGTVRRGGLPRKNVAAWRTFAKYLVYFLICVYLANTFLAYFVGVDRLSRWVRQSPLQHPLPFLVMAAATGAMMFNFCYFREQLCLIACPYGRFQSVLLDQNSVIVAYNEKRGEPRKKGIHANGIGLPIAGDCIDCGNCVTTCPTGIDIRKGLQMECINCTQCIDACNQVMKKIGRSPDLIRFSSQARDRGLVGGLVRARTIIYPFLIAGFIGAFLFVLSTKSTFDVVIMREPGNPYVVIDKGRIRNLLTMKLTNRSDKDMAFSARVLEPAGGELQFMEDKVLLAPRESRSFHVGVIAERKEFRMGKSNMLVQIENDQQDSRMARFTLMGPF